MCQTYMRHRKISFVQNVILIHGRGPVLTKEGSKYIVLTKNMGILRICFYEDLLSRTK